MENNILNYRLLERAEKYIAVMQGLTGIDVRTPNRHRDVVICRQMVAYRLIQDGDSTIAIGKVFDKDHSSVTYYKQRMEAILAMPWVFREENRLWELFNKQIEL